MITQVEHLDLSSITQNSKQYFKLNLIENALGDSWHIPVMVAKGKPGKTVGVTAAIHGNELNGIPTIHSLWKKIDVNKLNGTIIFVPVTNTPGFLNGTREFYDGRDLNRLMPGKKSGTSSERYGFALIEKLAQYFDYHFDLHTASEGRINSFYIRANLEYSITKKLAHILSPQIIVNHPGVKGSFRLACEKMNIPSLTIELGDPNLFQLHHIKPAYYGLLKVFYELGLIDDFDEKNGDKQSPFVCRNSYWMYAKQGGILQVYPELIEEVKKGQKIALITNVFGEKVTEIKAKHDGIVIGKATYPVCQEGSRVVHIGYLN